MRRRTARTRILVTASALVAVLLTSCAATPVPLATFSPTPDAGAPLFATDAEALAAAEAAYAAYLAVGDAVLATGGISTGALNEVAAGQALEYERAGAADFLANGLWATGATTFTTHRVQSVEQVGAAGVVVRFYVCDDLSAVDLVDANGVSQALPERSVLIPFLIGVSGDSVANMKITEKSLWADGNFC